MKKEEDRMIYVIGHVGNEGIKAIIDNKKKDLQDYFSKSFIDKIYKKILDEDKILSKFDVQYEKSFDTVHILPIKKGGVFSALWDMSKKEFVGMDFSQRDIPIHQEVIEICNFYDILPYRLLTDHSYIVFEKQEWVEKMTLKYEDVSIRCIGKLYNKKECARIDGDTKAYLTKDYKDEIDKVIPNYIKNMYKKNAI
ncbi:MAG: hypothetical protein MJ151_00765 [Lachnospiraceae bacterium]|nr:hypothetical protein [Lachnospiraceae bacterium]